MTALLNLVLVIISSSRIGRKLGETAYLHKLLTVRILKRGCVRPFLSISMVSVLEYMQRVYSVDDHHEYLKSLAEHSLAVGLDCASFYGIQPVPEWPPSGGEINHNPACMHLFARLTLFKGILHSGSPK